MVWKAVAITLLAALLAGFGAAFLAGLFGASPQDASRVGVIAASVTVIVLWTNRRASDC